MSHLFRPTPPPPPQVLEEVLVQNGSNDPLVQNGSNDPRGAPAARPLFAKSRDNGSSGGGALEPFGQAALLAGAFARRKMAQAAHAAAGAIVPQRVALDLAYWEVPGPPREWLRPLLPLQPFLLKWLQGPRCSQGKGKGGGRMVVRALIR